MVLFKNFSGSFKSQSWSFSISAADTKQEMWCVIVFFYFKQKVHSKLVLLRIRMAIVKQYWIYLLHFWEVLVISSQHLTGPDVCKRLAISLLKWVETLWSRIYHSFINQMHFISSRKIIDNCYRKYSQLRFSCYYFSPY